MIEPGEIELTRIPSRAQSLTDETAEHGTHGEADRQQEQVHDGRGTEQRRRGVQHRRADDRSDTDRPGPTVHPRVRVIPCPLRGDLGRQLLGGQRAHPQLAVESHDIGVALIDGHVWS